MFLLKEGRLGSFLGDAKIRPPILLEGTSGGQKGRTMPAYSLVERKGTAESIEAREDLMDVKAEKPSLSHI